MRIIGAAVSHEGNVKAHNEDNVFLFHTYRELEKDRFELKTEADSAHLMASVCDGIGGEANGEIASLLAVDALKTTSWEFTKESIDSQISAVNDMVTKKRREFGNRMGSTFTGVYFHGDQAIVANVGDSRVYLLRDGVLRQMSYDHTEVQRQIRMGIIKNASEAKESSKHKLTQNLGVFADDFEIEPYQTAPFTLQKGDRFLLCSDGLTDDVSDERIEAELNKKEDPLKTAKTLLQMALHSECKDNISVMILDVAGGGNSSKAGAGGGVKASGISAERADTDNAYAVGHPSEAHGRSGSKAMVIVVSCVLLVALLAGVSCAFLVSKKKHEPEQIEPPKPPERIERTVSANEPEEEISGEDVTNEDEAKTDAETMEETESMNEDEINAEKTEGEENDQNDAGEKNDTVSENVVYE